MLLIFQTTVASAFAVQPALVSVKCIDILDAQRGRRRLNSGAGSANGSLSARLQSDVAVPADGSRSRSQLVATADALAAPGSPELQSLMASWQEAVSADDTVPPPAKALVAGLTLSQVTAQSPEVRGAGGDKEDDSGSGVSIEAVAGAVAGVLATLALVAVAVKCHSKRGGRRPAPNAKVLDANPMRMPVRKAAGSVYGSP